ncbi:MAG: hypothetical protein SOV82_12510 [[Ruminococcus] gnavus]|nr:hypothetical protein [Mediterraneibacter gnavus]
MKKWNRKRVGILLICFLCTLYMGKEIYTIQPQRVSGIPDAINSIRCNTTEYLTVVANQKDMEDKHELAKLIVKMCQENSFRSIKFSYDMECPTELLIHVYRTEKGFHESKKFCEIAYLSEEKNEKYDIIHNPDKFSLYVDGKKVD